MHHFPTVELQVCCVLRRSMHPHIWRLSFAPFESQARSWVVCLALETCQGAGVISTAVSDFTPWVSVFSLFYPPFLLLGFGTCSASQLRFAITTPRRRATGQRHLDFVETLLVASLY